LAKTCCRISRAISFM